MDHDRNPLLAAILLLLVMLLIGLLLKPPVVPFKETIACEDEESWEDSPNPPPPEVPESPLVEVWANGAISTGFLVSRDGLLVTANHTVEYAEDGEPEVAVGYFGAILSFRASVLFRDVEKDVALLRIVESPLGAPRIRHVLELETDPRVWEDDVLPGRPALLVGCPHGDCTWGEGIVKRRGEFYDLAPWKLFARIWNGVVPGMSGSPVLGRSGRVVGVLVTGGIFGFDEPALLPNSEDPYHPDVGIAPITPVVRFLAENDLAFGNDS